MRIELGPVRIARMVGERVVRNGNGSVDVTVKWEDAVGDMGAVGVLHLHEREVAMIVSVVGKREINKGGDGYEY